MPDLWYNWDDKDDRLQVSDGSDRVQTLNVHGNRLEIGGETVQFIVAGR
jgi:hypothetical protein